MMLTFTFYLLSAYVALPLLYAVLKPIARKPQLCPLLQCLPQLISCLFEFECKQWIHQIQECMDPSSDARRISAERFAHVQHPHDAAYCTYQAFDNLTTDTAVTFLECIGKSGCLERATYSDQCADMQHLKNALPFKTVPFSIWQGKWRKLYSTGWDLWPCQWTVFSPPHHNEDTLQPEDWMMNWPKVDNVWRMDLTWRNSNYHHFHSDVIRSGDEEEGVTFRMCNEMYPNNTWNFSNHLPSNHFKTPKATLKTRAVMWGTEAHENWYLLHYDEDTQIMLIYYCAYTEAVDRFDSIAMVLQKIEQSSTRGTSSKKLTEEYREKYEQLVKSILGPMHGRLQRISDCK